jgi:hypothetical protein
MLTTKHDILLYKANSNPCSLEDIWKMSGIEIFNVKQIILDSVVLQAFHILSLKTQRIRLKQMSVLNIFLGGLMKVI